ncbi:SDR family NAD(P)-dependent oxidoreductase [Thermopolyspora sp. NPDC052614]|uniref:SDR family NAD(P)-dependent oxidoreductase n=1 Tax=Thermopolyspora sp. NPDC052614 TaxID=3155682 RepID=UPI003449E35D
MNRVVLVTGAGGAAGHAVVRRLAADGDTVIAAGTRKERLPVEATEAVAVDLLDRPAVRNVAADLGERHGRVDGVIHLVGGWRGAPSFAETDLADWDVLHDLLIRTLQHVSLEFEPLLRASGDGRFLIVSSKAAAAPTRRDAAYGAAKAAAEAWTLALAEALDGTGSAAVIFVIKALADDAMRAARPGATFAGFTDVRDLADRVAALWDRPAGELNGRRIDLTEPD